MEGGVYRQGVTLAGVRIFRISTKGYKVNFVVSGKDGYKRNVICIVSYTVTSLSLSHIHVMLFDASAADDVFKHVAKVEIVHNEKFLLFPKCFQLYAMIIFLFIKMFYILPSL